MRRRTRQKKTAPPPKPKSVGWSSFIPGFHDRPWSQGPPPEWWADYLVAFENEYEADSDLREEDETS